MPFGIREARLADIEAAARVRAQAWRESFTGFLPEEVLDNADAWAPEVAARWAHNMTDRGATYWVGVDKATGSIVGVSHADAATGPDQPTTLILKSLYVLDGAKGSGLAVALVRRAIGDDIRAHLWVIDGNERAIAFYRRLGFEPDGLIQDIEPGWPGGRQLRMVRR